MLHIDHLKIHSSDLEWSRQLETFDDFDDDATVVERGTVGMSNGHVSSLRSSKISQLVPAQPSKPKV